MITLHETNIAYHSETVSLPQNVFARDLSFTVPRGEFLGLCGGNGAGKSTLLKLIANLLPAYRGTITIDGLDLSQPENARKIRRKIGYLFQNPDNQIITTTVEDEIVFGLENYGFSVAEIDSKLNEALILADLAYKRKDDPTALSDGEKQKLLFAAILAMDPDILLLDEPTSMLDLLSAKRFLCLLPALRERRKTILLVTHRMEELMGCDRIAYLEKGEITLFKSPADFFRSISPEKVEITPWIQYLMRRFHPEGRDSGVPLGTPEEVYERYDRL